MRQPSRSSISFAPEWSARARIASGVARTNTSKWTKPGSAAAHAAKTEACFILATGTTLHLVGVCANRTGVDGARGQQVGNLPLLSQRAMCAVMTRLIVPGFQVNLVVSPAYLKAPRHAADEPHILTRTDHGFGSPSTESLRSARSTRDAWIVLDVRASRPETPTTCRSRTCSIPTMANRWATETCRTWRTRDNS